MTRTTPPLRSFSSGEIDPLLRRRSDYQRFQTGLAACNGFLPLVQGGVTRAPGTLYRGQTKSNLTAVLVPFIFAADDACILEFTDGKMRVWRYGALVESSPGVPYELATPWAAADLPNLRWQQTADVIYLVDGTNWPRTLKRLALDNWTLSGFVINSGPFDLENDDTTILVQADAPTGTVTLTASSAIFEAGHVNALMWLTPSDLSSVPYWYAGETSADIAVGDKRIYDHRIYQLQTLTPTNVGSTPPTHEKGTVATQLGVEWKYISDLDGIVRITAVASGTSATAGVIRRLPDQVVGIDTYRWAFGSWSTLNGYPGAVQLYDQRLVFAATTAAPRTIWFSAVGDFGDWFTDTAADDPFSFTIGGDGTINRILNLKTGKTGLHILALGQEFSARSETRSQVIGPTTAIFGLDSAVGSAPAAAILPYGSPIFIARDKARVAQIAYDMQSDANEVSILSRPSQHLGAVGFEEIVWLSSPQPMAVIRRTPGDLAVMVYDPKEDVLGWSTCSVAGGTIEALAVTPHPVTGEDVLTAVVLRTINAAQIRTVEEFTPWYGVLTGDLDVTEAQHFYCGLTFTPGSPTDTFALAHLKGEQVYAWTDAGEFGPFTVPGSGNVTLPQAVNRAHIGLYDATHAFETLDIQAAAQDGATDGRQKALIGQQTIALHQTAQGYVSAGCRPMDGPDTYSDPQTLVPRTMAAPSTDPLTGLVRTDLSTGLGREVSLRFTPYQGAPMTVLALVPTVNVEGS